MLPNYFIFVNLSVIFVQHCDTYITYCLYTTQGKVLTSMHIVGLPNNITLGTVKDRGVNIKFIILFMCMSFVLNERDCKIHSHMKKSLQTVNLLYSAALNHYDEGNYQNSFCSYRCILDYLTIKVKCAQCVRVVLTQLCNLIIRSKERENRLRGFFNQFKSCVTIV